MLLSSADRCSVTETGSRITGAVRWTAVLGPGPAAPVTGPMVEVAYAGVAATAGAAALHRGFSGAPVRGGARAPRRGAMRRNGRSRELG